ncbi:uncharacterized protein DS421_15g510410 [Arachis hypogaea]|nr:uncharacterized protein DS421_15g510410 [Arachis hypogaea]
MNDLSNNTLWDFLFPSRFVFFSLFFPIQKGTWSKPTSITCCSSKSRIVSTFDNMVPRNLRILLKGQFAFRL